MKKTGAEVLLNECSEDCDVIICMTISEMENLKKFHGRYPHIPIITYNWDWFSFVDKTRPPWPEFVGFMRKSLDVWTPTRYMVEKMERTLGLKHYIIEACSILEECTGSPADDGYVVQASRRDKRYKNFDFFEKGCRELDIPYVSCHPRKYSRKAYIDILRRCRMLVCASVEESNAALSTMEAAFFRKPLLISDIPPHREGWGDKAVYFKNNDISDFKSMLRGMYDGKIKADTNGAFDLAINRYTPKAMALAIDKRLKEILWV